MLRFSLVCSFLLFSTLSKQSYAKVIVWDMNGVLTQTSHSGVIKEIGLTKLLSYCITHFQSPLPGVFKALEDIWGVQENREDKNVLACHGITPLPQAMCHWQTGSLSGEDIIKKFSEHTEDSTLQSMVRAMFTPEVLIEHSHPIEEGVKLLNQYNTSDNTMVILSNFDPIGFKQLQEKEELKIIFKNFSPENIIVSGEHNTMKPHQKIYEILKKRLQAIDPRFSDENFLQANCLFLDDQKENVKAAIKYGIPSVQVPNKDYSQARLILQQKGFARKLD